MNKTRAIARQKTFKRHEEESEKKIRKLQNKKYWNKHYFQDKIRGKSKGHLF